jgi:hypothetical protein
MGFAEFAFALRRKPDFVTLFRLLGQLAVRSTKHSCLKLSKRFGQRRSGVPDWFPGLAISTVNIYFHGLNRLGSFVAGRASIPFHSDGVLWDVMDDLVTCGFDALQPIEPNAMDIHEVKRRYGTIFVL